MNEIIEYVISKWFLKTYEDINFFVFERTIWTQTLSLKLRGIRDSDDIDVSISDWTEYVAWEHDRLHIPGARAKYNTFTEGTYWNSDKVISKIKDVLLWC